MSQHYSRGLVKNVQNSDIKETKFPFHYFFGTCLMRKIDIYYYYYLENLVAEFIFSIF